MEEFFDNGIITANIVNQAGTIAKLKDQRNLAIAGCIVLGGIVVIAVYMHYKNNNEKN